MVNMRIKVAGIEFRNPILLPSGPFGNGRELSEYLDFSFVGAFTSKTVTPMPKDGNPPPRIVNIKNGILNSIGLQNPGIKAFVGKDMNFLRTIPTNLIVSVGGYKTADFVESVELLSFEEIKIFELNFSCPNVDGDVIGENPKRISEIVRAVKNMTKKPIFVKLGYNNRIEKLVEAAVREAVDGITLINSPAGTKIDINTGKAILKRGFGGISGPIIKPMALAMVYRVRKAFDNVNIISTGGAFDYKDAIEFLMAGANLVGIGAAAMVDFDRPIKILNGMKKFLEERGLNINDILSSAHRGGI